MLLAHRGLGTLQRLCILRLPSHPIENIRWHQSGGQSRQNTLPRGIDVVNEAYALIKRSAHAMAKIHGPSPFWTGHLELVGVDPFVASLHVIFKPSGPRIVRHSKMPSTYSLCLGMSWSCSNSLFNTKISVILFSFHSRLLCNSPNLRSVRPHHYAT